MRPDQHLAGKLSEARIALQDEGCPAEVTETLQGTHLLRAVGVSQAHHPG